MKRMNEKTMLWGQTSFNPDEVLEEDTRDEFEKATDFASKYFKVCESCYNKAKTRLREDAARTHQRATDYQKYFNEYCKMNGFPYHDPEELRSMEGPEVYADMKKYIMEKMPPLTESIR